MDVCRGGALRLGNLDHLDARQTPITTLPPLVVPRGLDESLERYSVKEKMSEQTKAQPCPKCNSLLDAATVIVGTPKPAAGDISVCAYCATILIFNSDLSHRIAKPEDVIGLPIEAMKTLCKAQRAILAMRGARN